MCEYVKENEPGVLQYQWFRVPDAEQPTIIVYETYVSSPNYLLRFFQPHDTHPTLCRYADKAAVETHKTSPKMAWLQEVSQKEENFAAPIKLLPLEEFAGWGSRS